MRYWIAQTIFIPFINTRAGGIPSPIGEIGFGTVNIN
jgi:hypothetical protein